MLLERVVHLHDDYIKVSAKIIDRSKKGNADNSKCVLIITKNCLKTLNDDNKSMYYKKIIVVDFLSTLEI